MGEGGGYPPEVFHPVPPIVKCSFQLSEGMAYTHAYHRDPYHKDTEPSVILGNWRI